MSWSTCKAERVQYLILGKRWIEIYRAFPLDITLAWWSAIHPLDPAKQPPVVMDMLSEHFWPLNARVKALNIGYAKGYVMVFSKLSPFWSQTALTLAIDEVLESY